MNVQKKNNNNVIERIVGYAKTIDGLNIDLVRDGVVMHQLHRKVELAVEDYLDNKGISPRQFDVLESLFHHQNHIVTPAELADLVSLTRSAMTSVLDSLEKAGYIARAQHPGDRRMVMVSLTALGLEFVEQQLPERYKDCETIVGHLTKEERVTMIEVYSKVLDKIQGLSELKNKENK